MNNNYGKIQVCKEGKKQHDFTIRFFVFNPKKHFIGTEEAKDLVRKDMHCSRKKMDEYDSLYGLWMKVGRGKNAHVEFDKTLKSAANVIFIIPKSKRKRCWDIIRNIEIPISFINENSIKMFK